MSGLDFNIHKVLQKKCEYSFSIGDEKYERSVDYFRLEDYYQAQIIESKIKAIYVKHSFCEEEITKAIVASTKEDVSFDEKIKLSDTIEAMNIKISELMIELGKVIEEAKNGILNKYMSEDQIKELDDFSEMNFALIFMEMIHGKNYNEEDVVEEAKEDIKKDEDLKKKE